jgi:Zn-finger nucleic acid-binding protein
MSERSGIEIDYCPQCRGIWLDRGELDKIMERNGQEMAQNRAEWTQSAQAAPPPEMPAPQVPYQQPPYQQPQPAPYQQAPYIRYDDDDHRHHGDHYDKHHKRRKKKSFLNDLFDFD